MFVGTQISRAHLTRFCNQEGEAFQEESWNPVELAEFAETLDNYHDTLCVFGKGRGRFALRVFVKPRTPRNTELVRQAADR